MELIKFLTLVDSVTLATIEKFNCDSENNFVEFYIELQKKLNSALESIEKVKKNYFFIKNYIFNLRPETRPEDYITLRIRYFTTEIEKAISEVTDVAQKVQGPLLEYSYFDDLIHMDLIEAIRPEVPNLDASLQELKKIQKFVNIFYFNHCNQ